MECCNRDQDKNENNIENVPVTTKPSDFSIDHILNRAGPKCCEKTVNLCDRLNFDAIGNIPNHLKIENNLPPMFDWLQYTRYRPPKLPRPLRAGPIKRTPGRLPRVPFTPAQLAALENAYKTSTYLSSEEANKLAIQLNLSNTRVKIWFQNRRARERREKRDKEEECTGQSSCRSPIPIQYNDIPSP